jgi:hypothetical protein
MVQRFREGTYLVVGIQRSKQAFQEQAKVECAGDEQGPDVGRGGDVFFDRRRKSNVANGY